MDKYRCELGALCLHCKTAFKASRTCCVPCLQHLIALAREVDLQPTWNKYCTR